MGQKGGISLSRKGVRDVGSSGGVRVPNDTLKDKFV